MKTNIQDLKMAFFGTPQLSVWALEEMEKYGIIPTLVITAPDARAGRGRILTKPPVKEWAENKGIDILQPTIIDKEFIKILENTNWDLFIVFAYGKILPKRLIDIPKYGSLNIHPSLLPKLRGPSPIRSAIRNDEQNHVGVSIIKMDQKMDHGPIVAQAKLHLNQWPLPGRILDEILSKEGGKMLSEILPKWINGDITLEPQNHTEATFCGFFKKSDGEIFDTDTDYEKYLKYCAYDGWPGVFFFDEKGKRVKITKAHLNEKGKFVIDKIIPEGGKERNYENEL